MVTMLLYGNYTPAMWQEIRADPGVAPDAIAAAGVETRCRLKLFFYALDDFDFYCFVEGDGLEQVTALRHLLFAAASFSRLHGEPLFTGSEILPVISAIRASSG